MWSIFIAAPSKIAVINPRWGKRKIFCLKILIFWLMENGKFASLFF